MSAAGTLFAFGGVLLAGYAGKAAQSMGDAYLLPAIAAVVLGGTSILGGRGSYLGTIAGVIYIGDCNDFGVGGGERAADVDSGLGE